MATSDRDRWDERHAAAGPIHPDEIGSPHVFAPYVDLFPTAGDALDLACGRGRSAVWLAHRGMHVRAVDVSPVAIDLARDLARRAGVADRCRFDVVDLDDGLPPGPPVDVVLCHQFRDARLDAAVVARLRPGGLLAIAALSEVDVGPGRYRVPAGDLPASFPALEVVASGEGGGEAWLFGRRPA